MHTRTTSLHIKINGLHVRPGTEMSFRGVAGRFRFVSATLKDGEILWVTVYGGSSTRPMHRSFRLSSVRRVHTKNKLRSNVA